MICCCTFLILLLWPHRGRYVHASHTPGRLFWEMQKRIATPMRFRCGQAFRQEHHPWMLERNWVSEGQRAMLDKSITAHREKKEEREREREKERKKERKKRIRWVGVKLQQPPGGSHSGTNTRGSWFGLKGGGVNLWCCTSHRVQQSCLKFG